MTDTTNNLKLPVLGLCLAMLLASCFTACSKQEDHASKHAGKTALFLLGEHEYGTAESLPAFAKKHLEPLGIESTLIFAAGDDRNSPLCHTFEGLEALKSADILILSTRRRFPKTEDLAAIRRFIESGKPVIAVRTASHAFGERAKGTGYQAPPGHAAWNSFDVDVLGASYQGHYAEKEGKGPLAVEARIEETASQHPILKNLDFKEPFPIGNKLYKYIDLDPAVNVLLSARYDSGEPAFPVAWTYEKDGKHVFYMSPGGTEEMNLPQIQSLLKEAVLWGLDR